MHRSLQYIGLSLVVLGAMVAIVPTGSFSTIAGDRPVDVAVAGDSEAFVAIIDTNNEVTKPGSGVTVAELENNLESSTTVEYEASVTSGSLAVENPTDTVTVRSGGSEPIRVSCTPPDGGSGTATLTVHVIEAVGRSATIRDASLEVPVAYDCPGRTDGANTPPDPGQPPGDAVAYVDADHDYAYDEGERIVPRGDLRTFDNDSAHLVIAAGGETLDYNRQVQIKAKSVTVGDATLATNKQLKIEAEGDAISFRDSTLDSKKQIQLKAPEITTSGTTITSDKQIKLTAESGELTLTGATVETKKQIRLASSGDMTLDDAEIVSTNGQARLALHRASATLAVDKAVLQDRDDTIVYTPSGVTVTGTPAQGSLSGYGAGGSGSDGERDEKAKSDGEEEDGDD